MENDDIVFQRALDNVEESILLALQEMDVPTTIDLAAIERSESTLDAWDYCYSIAIGLAGVFIATDSVQCGQRKCLSIIWWMKSNQCRWVIMYIFQREKIL